MRRLIILYSFSIRMKTITDLQSSDVLEINGASYQVLKHFELWYDDSKKEMDMCVSLVPVDNPQMSATHRLIYVRERAEQRSFRKYDAKTDRFLEVTLESIQI